MTATPRRDYLLQLHKVIEHDRGALPGPPTVIEWAHDEIVRLRAALEGIEIKARAGLCYFSLGAVREYHKDVRELVADALGRERPQR